jgi:hypothetical protein
LRFRRITLLFFALATVAAGGQEPPRPVSWSLSVTGGARGPRVSGVAFLKARIESGWRLYSMTQPPGGARATMVEILDAPVYRLAGSIAAPPPDTVPDAYFNMMSEIYEDSVTFRVPLRRLGAPGGNGGRLRVAVTFQVCSRRVCLLPRTDTVAARFDR